MIKEVVNNKDNLSLENMNKIVTKVRGIIIDNENNIILEKYADMYMLPGGKVDDKEDEIISLKRELKEELGLDLLNHEITPYLKTISFYKDYPYTTKINKLNKITYYIINTDSKIDTSRQRLTSREIEGNFSIQKININEVEEVVSSYQSSNPRYSYFKDELLQAIKEYKSLRKIDMHIHTTYSDGTLTPDEVITEAMNNNLQAIAITDHDTVKGLKNINLKYKNLKVINGIELSAKSSKGRMHILGYGINIYDENLNNKLDEIKTHNINHIISLLEQLKKDYDIVFSYDDLIELFNQNHNLGRPDLARLCVKNNLAVSIQDAFDKYLIEANEKIRGLNKRLTYKECLKLIRDAGGISVLAHPYTLELNEEEFETLLIDMINYGLQGLEIYHSYQSREQREIYYNLAKKYNLFITGGTDFHGDNKPDVSIGSGKNNNVKVKKLNILNYL